MYYINNVVLFGKYIQLGNCYYLFKPILLEKDTTELLHQVRDMVVRYHNRNIGYGSDSTGCLILLWLFYNLVPGKNSKNKHNLQVTW